MSPAKRHQHWPDIFTSSIGHNRHGTKMEGAVLCWGTGEPSSYTPLQQPHWLPTEYRIYFEIANITFHTLHSSQPDYLYSALHSHHSTCSKLSNTNLLSATFVHISLAVRSFSVAAPTIWNSLPPALQMCTSPDTFHPHLKTISSRPSSLLNAFLLAPQT